MALLASCSQRPSMVRVQGTILWNRWKPVVGERCPFETPPPPSNLRFYDSSGHLLGTGTTRPWGSQDPLGFDCFVLTSFSISVPRTSSYKVRFGQLQGTSAVSFGDLAKARFTLSMIVDYQQVHVAVGKMGTF
jgi:hypothetical protein